MRSVHLTSFPTATNIWVPRRAIVRKGAAEGVVSRVVGVDLGLDEKTLNPGEGLDSQPGVAPSIRGMFSLWLSALFLMQVCIRPALTI